jgi:hypothetical protein
MNVPLPALDDEIDCNLPYYLYRGFKAWQDPFEPLGPSTRPVNSCKHESKEEEIK